MIDGRCITDAAMLEVVVMIYDKSIKISWHNYKLTKPMPWDSLDGNLIQSKKRNHPTIDYGYVGDGSKKTY
jgi:acetylglutamate kinase